MIAWLERALLCLCQQTLASYAWPSSYNTFWTILYVAYVLHDTCLPIMVMCVSHTLHICIFLVKDVCTHLEQHVAEDNLLQ